MAAAFKQLFEERKAMPPKGDLLSIMDHSEVMADMDEQRFIGASALLLVGGNDTTRNSMSWLVEQMTKLLDQWERLQADRQMNMTAATDATRLQTPLVHLR